MTLQATKSAAQGITEFANYAVAYFCHAQSPANARPAAAHEHI
jgi:hypothetical protein